MSYQAALGRNVGKVNTDAGGLARYSLGIQLPPGIHPGSEPELSLEYSQGAPNGSVGVGWALGGISCIRRAPSNLAYDGVNPPPAKYNRSKPKLTLDGAELLNILGEYGSPDAKYMTELEQSGRIVSVSGSGFIMVDSTGMRAEYGTTEDARVLEAGGEIREWRLRTSSDYHGNTSTYTYVKNPQNADVNAIYISSIRYSSNPKTGYKGGRVVNFEYSPRPDVLVQRVHGGECAWASLLTAIRCAVILEEVTTVGRSYELEYAQSKDTGDSCLVSVTETAPESNQKVKLLPSTFGYSAMDIPMEDIFKSRTQQVSTLHSTTDNVTLFSMNISGRCLADLAVIRFTSNRMSIKTYLAIRGASDGVEWVASDGPGAEASLPAIDFKAGFPDILCPDLSNDGRADFVVPYPDRSNNLQFSISKGLGTGFQDARIKTTAFAWTAGSKFMAVDNIGRSPSIIQIFTDRNKLTFRNFPSFNSDGQVGLLDAVTSSTSYANTPTIEWIQLTHAGTGAKSLVRIWADDLGLGRSQIKATTFTIAEDETVREGTTSMLGEPTHVASTRYSVLSCDINADGAQDIMLATADYSNGRIGLTVRAFLGDGYGEFQEYGGSIFKEVTAPTPLKTSDFGRFHVTNLNGSNYPSLSYVYRVKYTRAYACVTVDGRSDGLLGNAVCHELATDLPGDNLEVTAVDLNGNGMGDWLFHTFDGGVPKVAPVYNRAKVVDLLSLAEDSMGLRTSIAYGYLSDHEVYAPGVDWKKYANTLTDSYPVIAAPNYVVTSLEHSNNPSINSNNYHVLIRKTYAKARINSVGRGWQGFEEVHTINVTDGILTTEKYHQAWPLTGSKIQIDTKTPAGQIIKSVKSTFHSISKTAGSWNIYRNQTMLEQTDFLDGLGGRSHMTEYDYDDRGNMILQSPSETQQGQAVSQYWKRCAYTTIDGVTGVLTAQKVSSQETNKNMTKFEQGDLSLTLFENEVSRPVLRRVLTWSTDIDDFSKKTFIFDEYGRESQSTDAASLQKSIIYDPVLQTHAVKVTEQGPGVNTTELIAYDVRSGQEAARLETNGLLTCYQVDGFGRTLETRTRGPTAENTLRAPDFFAQSPYLADAELLDLLSHSYLLPQRRISFERQFSPGGQAHIAAKVVTIFKAGLEGEHEATEYINCIKQVYKRSTREGSDTQKTWVSWEYNTRGQPLFESFPIKVSPAVGLDWVPNTTSGIRSAFDILGRPLSRVRPNHGDKSGFIVSSTEYLNGGARTRESTLSASNGSAPFENVTKLAQVERRHVRAGKEDRVLEMVDENGLHTTYEYDATGRLTKCTDAAGNVECRSYNSQGNIVALDNPYQNPTQATGRTALRYNYNVEGHLVSEMNAAGEVVTYQRDAKGRTLVKSGQDGRVMNCIYDQGGFEGLSSVAITTQGASRPESLLELTYDHGGQIKERKLTLADGSRFMTSLAYDWQGQVVQKILPGGVMLANDYYGSEVARSTLSGSGSTWKIEAETTTYSAFGRPETLDVRGSGLKEAFTHTYKYDAQGFPLTHSLGTSSKLLVDKRYVYNDMDQLARSHEFLSGQTSDYSYHGRRLLQSQTGSGIMAYAYDAAGNVTRNRDTVVTYSPGRVVGTKDDNSSFEVTYDEAGRTIQRQTARSSLALSYDSFGALKSVKDSKKNSETSILADHDGAMLQRKHSDGSSDLLLNDDLSMHIQSDGLKVYRYHLYNHDEADNKRHVVASISTIYESSESVRPLSKARKLGVQFTDTKGNVTHVFDGDDAALREKLEYDDFGLLGDGVADQLGDDAHATYEGTYVDNVSGLLNFGGRWYDPLVCRFTTPDDVYDVSSLFQSDGLNRFAFENNDPINNTDPTGHWTWSSILGVVAGAALIVAAVAVTVATGGAAGVLIGALVGGLAAGGVAGIQYSIKNKDEQDAGRFWCVDSSFIYAILTFQGRLRHHGCSECCNRSSRTRCWRCSNASTDGQRSSAPSHQGVCWRNHFSPHAGS